MLASLVFRPCCQRKVHRALEMRADDQVRMKTMYKSMRRLVRRCVTYVRVPLVVK